MGVNNKRYIWVMLLACTFILTNCTRTLEEKDTCTEYIMGDSVLLFLERALEFDSEIALNTLLILEKNKPEMMKEGLDYLNQENIGYRRRLLNLNDFLKINDLKQEVFKDTVYSFVGKFRMQDDKPFFCTHSIRIYVAPEDSFVKTKIKLWNLNSGYKSTKEFVNNITKAERIEFDRFIDVLDLWEQEYTKNPCPDCFKNSLIMVESKCENNYSFSTYYWNKSFPELLENSSWKIVFDLAGSEAISYLYEQNRQME